MAAERRGSRWLHEQPTEEEVRDWFGTQPLHDGMDHNRYVSGIVLIGATEKYKEPRQKQNGDIYIVEQERVVYVPYVKVDTRIAYFWDLVDALNGDGDKYEGKIEPVVQKQYEDPNSAYFNGHLPDGFFMLPIRNANDTVSRFLGARWEARIIERESGRVFRKGQGTKQTSLARNWADDNAIMKAETGAIGRALGVAGMLVIGTGVATAEDMQEAAAGPSGAAASSSEGPTLPTDDPGAPQGPQAPDAPIAATTDPGAAVPRETSAQEDDEALRAHMLELQREFERDHPERWLEFRTWWTETRNLGRLSELSGPVLRGAATKLERDLDAARQAKVATA